MQIKVDRFLTLTAMLASTQVGLVGCGDDGSEPTPEPDAGETGTSSGAPAETEPTAGSSETASAATSEASSSTPGIGITLEPGDAGADAASIESSADGAVSSSSSEGETTQADASTSGAFTEGDAGGFTCAGGDIPDESAFERCYETFAECTGYTVAYPACSTLAADYRSGIFEQFWDCYTEQDIADPCSEEAEVAASTCYSFAVESVCLDEVDECAAIVAGCNEVTSEDCSAYLRPHHSAKRAYIAECMSEYAALYAPLDAGPSYEGCSYHFYDCFYGPSVE